MFEETPEHYLKHFPPSSRVNEVESLKQQLRELMAQKEQAQQNSIRAIVREELAALKAELVKDVLKNLRTEIRLQAGVVSLNEARISPITSVEY